MTNRMKFKEEKLSFAEVLDIFNKSGMTSFDEFLNKPSHKYKTGDLVVLELNDYTIDRKWKHEVVFEILGTTKISNTDMYVVKFLTPTAFHSVNSEDWYPIEFIDTNTNLY